jgi:hypothetical protein
MPVSPKDNLSLGRIAWLWSAELGRTGLEATPDRSSAPEIFEDLVKAFIGSKLRVLTHSQKYADSVREAAGRRWGAYTFKPTGQVGFDLEFKKGFRKGCECDANVDECYFDKIHEGDDTFTEVFHCYDEQTIVPIPHLRVPRKEFMQWAEERGYPRPKFWGDDPPKREQPTSKPAEPAHSAAERACVQLLSDGVEPGGGDCSWAQFQKKVKHAIAPSTKGTSPDNLKKIVGKLRAARR